MYYYVFFFQAEDGIRDADVTGVQTCALPIWFLWESQIPHVKPRFPIIGDPPTKTQKPYAPPRVTENRKDLRRREAGYGGRSEERRVGKEWRAGRGGEG